MKPTRSILSLALIALCHALPLGLASAKPKPAPVELNADGIKAEARYSARLEALRSELKPLIPQLDATALAQLREAKVPRHNAVQEKAVPLVESVDAFLAKNSLDAKLVECAVLADAGPRGLAEFAQQSAQHAALVDLLLGNPALMQEMLVAGGAKANRYGRAMEILQKIHQSADHPVKDVFHRLALAVSLEYAAPETNQLKDIDPVKRYKFYEKSYVDGALDSHFKNHSIFLLRQVVNDPNRIEDMVWMREMLWNYRPDFIQAPAGYRAPYVGLMYSEFGHKRPEWNEELPTTRMQQAIDRGGQCGPKAFFGRCLGRAFGLPVWGARLRSHTAMTFWTPKGWTQILGVSFGNGFWTADAAQQRAWYFKLDAMARENQLAYLKHCRAQWVGDVLGEGPVDGMKPDASGGDWNALAYHAKKIAVNQRHAPDENKRPVWMNDAYPKADPQFPELVMKPVPGEQDRRITVGAGGEIKVPAVACISPTTSTNKIVFMKHRNSGMQLHYKRWKMPEPIVYEVEAPVAGRYGLSAEVVTVNREQFFLVSVNGAADPVRMEMPYTIGFWGESQPVEVTLKKGINRLVLNRTVPEDFEKQGYRFAGPEFGGITFKALTLTPIK